MVVDQISIGELKDMARRMFGNLVKAVVDVEKEVMAVDAELHVDLLEKLIEDGSKQENLWGLNIYPEREDENWIEFDSMINLKPLFGNRTRNIENPETRDKIIKIVSRLVKK